MSKQHDLVEQAWFYLPFFPDFFPIFLILIRLLFIFRNGGKGRWRSGTVSRGSHSTFLYMCESAPITPVVALHSGALFGMYILVFSSARGMLGASETAAGIGIVIYGKCGRFDSKHYKKKKLCVVFFFFSFRASYCRQAWTTPPPPGWSRKGLILGRRWVQW